MLKCVKLLIQIAVTTNFLLIGIALYPEVASAVRTSRIDEASVGEEGTLILEYGQDAFEETSAIKTGRDVASYFNFGYAVNERLAVRARLLKNELSGGTILFNPIFNNLTSADGWGLEFKIELDEVHAVYPTPEVPQFQPGSAFSAGIGFGNLGIESDTVDTTLNTIYGFLLYSTDFLPELRAHTLFSLSHFTSDFRRGNTTSIGVGGDYNLFQIGKDGKLLLFANGLIDVISIRKPTFDTGRVTRFDAGLRLVLSDTFSGYAGYTVVNDSFSDKNSQGFFYGVAITPNIHPVRVEAPKEEGVEKQGEVKETEEGAQINGASAPQESGQSQVGEKGTSGVFTREKVSSMNGSESQTPTELIENEREGSGDSSEAVMEDAEGSGNYNEGFPQPTTSERMVRPPAIEKPWEMLPIGYDFHPIVALEVSSVSAPETETEEEMESLHPENNTNNNQVNPKKSKKFKVFSIIKQ